MLESEVMSKLALLRQAAGGKHIALSRTFDWFESGNTVDGWSAYRGDKVRSYRAATMNEAITKAIQGVEE